MCVCVRGSVERECVRYIEGYNVTVCLDCIEASGFHHSKSLLPELRGASKLRSEVRDRYSRERERDN